jgi:hypothetical protein
MICNLLALWGLLISKAGRLGRPVRQVVQILLDDACLSGDGILVFI